MHNDDAHPLLSTLLTEIACSTLRTKGGKLVFKCARLGICTRLGIGHRSGMLVSLVRRQRQRMVGLVYSSSRGRVVLPVVILLEIHIRHFLLQFGKNIAVYQSDGL